MRDFSLSDSVICRSNEEFLGYWTDNGYPYFSGIGCCQTFFTLETVYTGCRYRLKAEKVWDGMAVKLNDQLVDVRTWPPFDIDIT